VLLLLTALEAVLPHAIQGAIASTFRKSKIRKDGMS
jgi:hypothetical protein